VTTFASELGRIFFTLVTTTAASSLLRESGRKQQERKESNMDEDMIIGLEPEYVGSVGSDYDIVGDDDEDLLDALEVGDDDGYDIEGDDDDLLIEGDGTSEIVGARRRSRRRRRPSKRRKRILGRIARRGAGVVVKKGLRNKRRMPLGFVPTSIAAGASALIPSAPQNLFRPERLVIPSDIAFDFGVRDIKVGNVSQLVQSVEVPAAIFSEVAINTGVTFDTAEVGNQVSVDARNKTAGAIEFVAALVGTIAK
jgi:hypothetical protein